MHARGRETLRRFALQCLPPVMLALERFGEVLINILLTLLAATSFLISPILGVVLSVLLALHQFRIWQGSRREFQRREQLDLFMAKRMFESTGENVFMDLFSSCLTNESKVFHGEEYLAAAIQVDPENHKARLTFAARDLVFLGRTRKLLRFIPDHHPDRKHVALIGSYISVLEEAGYQSFEFCQVCGLYYDFVGDSEKAQAAFQSMITDFDFDYGRTFLAVSLLLDKRFGDALDVIRGLEYDCSGFWHYDHVHGQCLLANGLIAEAVTCFTSAWKSVRLFESADELARVHGLLCHSWRSLYYICCSVRFSPSKSILDTMKWVVLCVLRVIGSLSFTALIEGPLTVYARLMKGRFSRKGFNVSTIFLTRAKCVFRGRSSSISCSST